MIKEYCDTLTCTKPANLNDGKMTLGEKKMTKILKFISKLRDICMNRPFIMLMIFVFKTVKSFIAIYLLFRNRTLKAILKEEMTKLLKPHFSDISN